MEKHSRKLWDDMTRWRESIWKEECPFCELNDSLIIWKWKYWNIRHNKYPYAWLDKHLLLIPNKHKEHTKELSHKELMEIKIAEQFFSEYYGCENYFSLIRQTNWWKSIKHLHYHYIPWILYSNKLEKILKEGMNSSLP
jgi:diadenosine tetraphosphate (Ap4A) HIT family hydrolase